MVQVMSLLAFFILPWISCSKAMAMNLIPGEILFETKVSAPKRVRVCDGKLFVLSQSAPWLAELDWRSGKKLDAQIDLSFLKPQEEITAFDCYSNQVLLGIRRAGRGIQAHADLVLIGQQGQRVISIPGGGEIRDIRCEKDSCFILRNSVFVLKANADKPESVMRLDVSDSQKINVGDSSKNPFEDWQGHFVIADSSYSRLAVMGSRLALLDPLRVSVILWPLDVGGQAQTKAMRFGDWGIWEGKLNSPKAILFLNPDLLLISDPGFGTLSVFDVAGKYIGTVSPKHGDGVELPLLFSHGLDLASNMGSNREDLIYVADFRGEKITGIKIAFDSNHKSLRSVTIPDTLTRPKWLKRPELKCLECHDGTLLDSLKNLRVSMQKHPKQECKACHDPHHVQSGDMQGEAFKQKCLKCHEDHFKKSVVKFSHPIPKSDCLACHQMHTEFPKQLKQDPETLCLSCHAKIKGHLFHLTVKEKNPSGCISCHNIHLSTKKEPIKACLGCHELELKSKHFGSKFKTTGHWLESERACVTCHDPHREPKIAPELCLQCHRDRNQSHKAPIIVAGTERAQGIKLQGNKLYCLTCHDPHRGAKDTSVIKTFCSSCHDQKGAQLFDSYHKRKAKGEAHAR